MIKQFGLLVIFSLSVGSTSAQTLSAGDDVFLTLRAHCQELPDILSDYELLFNERLESPVEELSVVRTLKTNNSLGVLERFQQASRCILALSLPVMAAPFAVPLAEVNLLPQFKTSPFLGAASPFFNDPLYEKQNFLQIISAENAYQILMADADFLRTPVRIGIIDEGAANDLHEDLNGIITANSDVGRSNVKHGQYVLGIMAAQSGNKRGIVGAAPFNTHFTYRAMTYVKGKVNSAHLANTIREFGRLGMDAVNLSIAIERPCSRLEPGSHCYHPIVADATIRRAIQETAKTYGTLFVLSASNEGQKVPRYVTADEGILVVGNSTSSGKVASYSNHGAGVDLYVPDNGVYGLTKEGYSSSLSGTSFAAPVVTAAAALSRHYLISRGVRASAGEIARHILRNATIRRELTRNESSGLELNLGKTISTTLIIE